MESFKDSKHLNELKFLQIVLRNVGSAYRAREIYKMFSEGDSGAIESEDADMRGIRCIDGSAPKKYNVDNLLEKMNASCMKLGFSKKFKTGYIGVELSESEIESGLRDGWRRNDLDTSRMDNNISDSDKSAKRAFLRDFLLLDFGLHGSGEQDMEDARKIIDMIGSTYSNFQGMTNTLNSLYESGMLEFYGDGTSSNRDSSYANATFVKFKMRIRRGFNPERHESISDIGYYSNAWNGKIPESEIDSLYYLSTNKPNGFTAGSIERLIVEKKGALDHIDITKLYRKGMIERTVDYLNVAGKKAYTEEKLHSENNPSILYRVKKDVVKVLESQNTIFH